ncbi:hypothetical protein F4802DRAFT_576738 [Xylaria palmicola]|nr:hypothetical protein F4802DRAFT_576738 [Xylaria palmicola]
MPLEPDSPVRGLKVNPSADMAFQAWQGLARHAEEMLVAIASTQFSISKCGQYFVSVVLRFVWLDEEQLRYDPSIIKADEVYVTHV